MTMSSSPLLLSAVVLLFLGLSGMIVTMTSASSSSSSSSSASSSSSFIPSTSSFRRSLEDQDQNDPNDHVNKQTDIRDFKLWTSQEIHSKAIQFGKQYPNLVTATTSQEKYGLPAAGGHDDCPFTPSTGCQNIILEVQDYIAHPIGSDSSNALPEVFWSGCLHGNERVGPTSTMEALTLLLEAADCEATSKEHDAIACRQRLATEHGMDNAHRKWLARIVATRRIVIVPTANALGYYQNKRTEGMVDPNRDFPYDLEDAKLCMQTIAGRTLNEIYREHMFRLALTFHAGMEVVGYEWGAPTWLEHSSPDDEAQLQIASAYSRFGGGWSTSKPYNFGTMNDLVYYVRGGMEDWAYAGSWDPDRVINCAPNTFGGYPAEKTTYDNSTLRVFNMLVETSDNKEPRRNSLGTTLDVLDRDTSGNGHVSRNIRLALLAAELVEPYTAIVAVNQLALSDDIVPSTERGGRSCQKSKAVMIAQNAEQVEIKWTVGGAMTIDDTELWYAKWDDIPDGELDCLSHPSSTEYFQQGTILGVSKGTGAFSRAGSHPNLVDGSSDNDNASEADKIIGKETIGPIFRGTIPIPAGLNTLDQLVVVVSARVDQDWKDNNKPDVKPNIPPQSHVVNARIDPNWRHVKAENGKVVQGRLDWFSVPLTIVIGDFKDNVGSQGGHLVNTMELHPRFGGAAGNGMKPKSAEERDQLWFPVASWEFLAVSFLTLVVCMGCYCCVCKRSDGRRGRNGNNNNIKRRRITDIHSDDFVFDSKPYSDKTLRDEYGDDDSDDESDGEVELPSLS